MNEGECFDGCQVCLGPVGRWWGAAAGWVSLWGFFLVLDGGLCGGSGCNLILVWVREFGLVGLVGAVGCEFGAGWFCLGGWVNRVVGL